MIASVGKGGGAGGAVAYALDEKKERGKEAEIVANTTSGRTGREITQEFDAVQALRPDVERRTFFASLAAAPGEHLSNAQWGEVARGFAEHMGYGRGPYVAVVHRETAHEHVHLIASRVGVDGKLVSDSHDYYKAQAYAREVERTYQLERVASSWERGAERGERQPAAAMLGRFERTGEEPMMLAIRRIAGDDFKQASTWEDLAARLDRHGLRVERGARGAGLVVTDGAQAIKASEVGRAYSRANLEQRLGGYDAFLERQQQQRAEPARLIEQPGRGDAGRIQERYADLAVSGDRRGEGPGAGRDPECAAEPGRGADDLPSRTARGSADDGRGGAGGGPGDHGRGGEVGARAAGLQGAERGGGRGEGDRAPTHADRAELGGAAPLPDVADRGRAGAGAVAGARAPHVDARGPGGRAVDERGAGAPGAQRPGDRAGLPEPAAPAAGPLRDRGVHGLGAPGADPLPGDRAGIERALAGAQRAGELHQAADRAERAHVEAWARLHRDPAGARAQFETMRRTLGPEMAADVLRRTPQAFGPLTEAARSGAAALARDVLTAGEQARAAEGQRPRMPTAQVAAEVARLNGLMQPFRAQDRAQVLERQHARELQRAIERGLGLDRDRGRGR